MMDIAALVILAGALAGGFVSGLTGFGTGLTALPFWLLVLQPAAAGTLVIICSIAGQLLALPAIWHAIDWQRVRPFVIGGVLGVPFGTWFLLFVDPIVFRLIVGVLLTLYCFVRLVLRRQQWVASASQMTNGLVGFLGGVLGGLAGLSGVLPTIWTGLLGWRKAERRAVFQSFNLAILTLALAGHFTTGLITKPVLHHAVLALPVTALGVWLGHLLYRRTPDARYDQIVLVLLMMAGAAMVTGNVGFVLG